MYFQQYYFMFSSNLTLLTGTPGQSVDGNREINSASKGFISVTVVQLKKISEQNMKSLI